MITLIFIQEFFLRGSSEFTFFFFFSFFFCRLFYFSFLVFMFAVSFYTVCVTCLLFAVCVFLCVLSNSICSRHVYTTVLWLNFILFYIIFRSVPLVCARKSSIYNTHTHTSLRCLFCSTMMGYGFSIFCVYCIYCIDYRYKVCTYTYTCSCICEWVKPLSTRKYDGITNMKRHAIMLILMPIGGMAAHAIWKINQ